MGSILGLEWSIGKLLNIADIAIYIIILIVGFVLSRKRIEIGAGRKALGFFILLAEFVFEYFLIGLIFEPKTVNGFMIVCLASYALKIVVFAGALALFTGYSPSKYVCVILIILLIICAFRSLYTAKVMFGVNSFFKDPKLSLKTLIAFMSNPMAYNVSKYLCSYVPPVILILDAITSLKKDGGR